MAVEETTIEVELEADIFTLKRNNGDVRLYLGDSKQPVPPKITGAQVSAEGDLTILGRPLGKVAAGDCTLKLGGETESSATLEGLRDAVGVWYPPGNVKHVHSLEEFDNLKAEGILCAKFSAEWCGPCKMVAPAIDAMSLKYTNVKFVHMDEADVKALFQREGIRAYPTFKFFKNGSPAGEVVQGADAAKVEVQVKKLGGIAEAVNSSSAPIPDGTIKFVCQREVVKLEKTSSGISFSVNGKKQENCPRVEINPETGDITFGRGGGKVWSEGGYDLNAFANTLKEWFPSKVKHIHSTEEFDNIVATGITVAKFSAEWCGPCKAIAGEYIGMSNTLTSVNFLHIDVDQQKSLSQREGIEAMPTFHFFQDGSKKADLMVRGANLAKVKANLRKLGVDC